MMLALGCIGVLYQVEDAFFISSFDRVFIVNG